jgi:hypothetical protein
MQITISERDITDNTQQQESTQSALSKANLDSTTELPRSAGAAGDYRAADGCITTCTSGSP